MVVDSAAAAGGGVSGGGVSQHAHAHDASARSLLESLSTSIKPRERLHAITSLEALIENVSFARHVDAKSLVVRFVAPSKQEKRKLATWPALLRATCECVEKEHKASKSTKAGLKPVFTNAVLRVVQKADDAWRTGGRRMLGPCILDLFKHTLEIVREDGETSVKNVSSNVSAEYRTLLSRLLDVPAYCQACVDEGAQEDQQPFAQLIFFYVDMLTENVNVLQATGSGQGHTTTAGGAASALTQRAKVLGSMLRRYPLDISPSLGIVLVEFLVDALRCDGVPLDGPAGAALVGALNQLMLRMGPDINVSWARQIDAAIAPKLLSTWTRHSTNELTREEITRYFRANLHLTWMQQRTQMDGDDDRDTAMASLRDCVGRELARIAENAAPRDAHAFRVPMREIGGAADARRYTGVVPRREVGLTLLAADLAVRCCHHPNGGAADAGGDGPSQKRARMSSTTSCSPSATVATTAIFANSAAALAAHCAESPAVYVPVLCCTLNHPLNSRMLDDGGREALLAALADSLPKALELGTDVEARVSAGTQLWMLRWASHLAVAWSSGSHHADWLRVHRTVVEAMPLYARKERMSRSDSLPR